MAKKVLVFLTATFFLFFVGLLVVYFYSHKSVNKENDIVNFIPPQTDFVIRITEISATTNEFFTHPIVKQCFNMTGLRSSWMVVDSITSRNYKTAEILAKNTAYICKDSTRFLMLIDLDKKTNDHFIDQFLSNSTEHRKIEKFKEGYKAFYPQEGKPMYYFIKHNVMGISETPEYVLSSLTNADTEHTDSLISDWNKRSTANISIWGRNGTETGVLDSFISSSIFFNGWIDKLSACYFLEISIDKDQIEFSGEMQVDSARMAPYHLFASSQKHNVLMYGDTGKATNYIISSVSKDSLGKENNLIYTYHQFKDSANNNAQLLISNSTIVKYMFTQVLNDTSVQLISMADEKIPKIAVISWKTASGILPIIPVTPDTGSLFVALYKEYFLVSNQTSTVLQAVSLIEKSGFIKNSLEKGVVLSGIQTLGTPSNIQSSFNLKWNNRVMQINCVLKQTVPD